MSIHPTAIVSDSAVLADDVELGAYCVIGNEVVVEAGCRIGSHVVINGPTRIGRSNRIYQFCSLGDDPQDKKYAGEPTRLEIGNNNTIREFCTISRGPVQDQVVDQDQKHKGAAERDPCAEILSPKEGDAIIPHER